MWDRATSVSERSDFQEVDDIVLDGHFWQQVWYILQFTKPIYIMIRFADTDRPVIGEVYEQMYMINDHFVDDSLLPLSVEKSSIDSPMPF